MPVNVVQHGELFADVAPAHWTVPGCWHASKLRSVTDGLW